MYTDNLYSSLRGLGEKEQNIPLWLQNDRIAFPMLTYQSSSSLRCELWLSQETTD